MKISIIVFPGTNREHDMALALKNAGASDVKLVWHKETSLPRQDLIIIPGGFSYGDYLRCGAMAAHSPIMKEVMEQVKSGVRLFGVCNGFQILVETGLLPGALLHNNSLKFICKQVHLKAVAEKGLLAKDSMIHVPVAHGEGNYFAHADLIREMEDHDQVAFRYCNENGEYTASANINGSSDFIAGVYSKDKRILGMMPHPENAVLPHHGNQSAEGFFTQLLNAA